MELFGLVLTDAQMFLLAVAGGGVGVFVAIRGPLLQSSIQRHADACANFRAAFADAQLNLERSEIRAAEITRSLHVSHIQAIREFSHHVPLLSKRGFKKACAKYHECAEPYLQMGVVGQFQSELPQHMQTMRSALKQSIDSLVSYATKT